LLQLTITICSYLLSYYKIEHIFNITFVFLGLKWIRKEPHSLKRFLDFFLTKSTSVGKESLDDSIENYMKNQAYFMTIDTIIQSFH